VVFACAVRFPYTAAALIETDFIRNLVRRVSKFSAPLFAFSIMLCTLSLDLQRVTLQKSAEEMCKKTLAWFRAALNKKSRREKEE
jgi:hypothetical protein